jgi:subtilisin family serine protease
MSSRLLLVLALLATAGAPAGAAASARVDSAVRAQAAAGGPVDVIVSLRRQAAPASLPTTNRGARLRHVVRALRELAAGEQRRVLALLAIRRAQGRVTQVRPFWIFDGLQVVAEPGVIDELAKLPEVAAITANTTVEAPSATTTGTAEWNVERVNAPALWGLGRRGQGVVVASMDTGVDVSHPELASRWRGGANSWYDPNGEHPATPTDVSGHGTWTMGAIVGGDAGGSAIGVAPDARWIAVKIFNDRGTATAAGIHAGYQWLLDPDGDPSTADAPHVVNNSWTMSGLGCDLTFQPDLRSLRAAGIVPVFAVGNGGALTAGSGLSPANNPEAFAVGDTDAGDILDPESSRGPSACPGAAYPAIAAPGVGIRTTDRFGFYTAVSGSSMAAPHVTGAVALLLGAYPGLDADQQASALRAGALDLGAAGPDDEYGAGRLDARAAYDWLATAPDFSVAATPVSATVPAGGSATFDIAVTARNGFTGPVTLAVSGLGAGQAGWSLAPATVTGGSGTSALTVTTAPTLAPGTYALTITGTSGTLSHTAAVALEVPAPPDFSLTATPASRSTLAGGAVTYTVSATAAGGFGGTLALSLEGLTQGSWAFSPATIAGGAGASVLTVTAGAQLAAGTYPLTVRASSGALSHTVPLTLVVSPAPDFGVALSPASATVTAGQSTSYTLAVTSVGGFAGTVTPSASGLPSGASASFAPSSVRAPGTIAVTIRTIRSTTRGTFTLRVTGRSGTLSHQATATLVVRS